MMMAPPISSSSSSSSISISFLFFSVSLFLLLLCSSEKGYALRGGDRQTLQSTYFHTVPINSLLPASVCSPSTKGNSNGASSLKVVHKHGPCSPLTLDKASAPTLTQILTHDQSRVNSIQSRLSFNLSQNNSFQDSQASLPAKSGLLIGSGNYFVTVGLGTPKNDLSLIFDTGSDLTWTQCQPCAVSCYNQQDPIFDPSVSSTYQNITCNSAQCSQLSSATSFPPGCSSTTCIYDIQYGDNSFSKGFFGSETLTLTPSDVFPNFLFGCGENNQGLFNGTAGLLGLGQDQLSFVSQTASIYGKYFSYCLPSTPSSTGYLTFGQGGSSGALEFTPLLSNSQSSSFYFIDITAIKVGGQTLSISPSVFQNAGTIIDSGTVITRLPPGAYTPLQMAFQQQMTNYPMTNGTPLFDTCYDLSNYNTVSIPNISFIFSGNIEVPLDPSGIIIGLSASQVCLAFAGNSADSAIGIFGNAQQKTLEVVYDVTGGKLGFGAGGCS